MRWYSLPYPVVTRMAIVRVMNCVCACGRVGEVTPVVLSTEVGGGIWWKIVKERSCLEYLCVDGMIL